MLTADMKHVIREQRLGFVATVNPDGTPNVSPKATFVVLDHATIGFGDIRSPRSQTPQEEAPESKGDVTRPHGPAGSGGRGYLPRPWPRLA
jgi:hypothetical protein